MSGRRAMSDQNLIVEQSGPIARVTVNRPKVLNALNRATLAELQETFSSLGANPAVRAVVLTGAGEKAFIAGADISELASLGPLAARAFASEGQRLCDRISRLSKPVIAAINGFALGGGCEVALACHIRIASSNARLGQPEVNLGVIPGWGGTQRLPRLVGRGRALDLLLTGDAIGAEDAFRIGLVNRVVEPEALLPACEETATKIAARGPLAVRLVLEAVQRGLEGSLAAGIDVEADAFGLAASTSDWREGTAAFLEKRKPSFRGE
jgi:enoyl-CoA hydratase